MKKTIKLITIICLLLNSCQKDDTIQYLNVSMGNFIDGKFVNDYGITFNIREQETDVVTDTMKRALIVCDILSRTGDGTYDIRLTNATPVFTKAHVDSTSVTDNDVLVEDPLNIAEMWISGGYINMYIHIPMKEDSTRSHLINLMRDDENAVEGTYEFTLKHNAYGEVITAEDKDLILGGTYVSFPVADLIKEDDAVICISWTSQKSDADGWIAETEKNTLRYEWTRGGYEHDL